MTSPKHLWSGDWERESAAAAGRPAPAMAPPAGPPEQPATARREPLAPPRPEPHAPPRPEPHAPPRPRVTPRAPRTPQPRPAPAPGWLGRRVVLLAVLGAVVLVGGVWALTAGGSTATPPAGLGSSAGYLGLNLQSIPVNHVLVQSVVPGSPADQAGIGPGDLLLSVNGRIVASPGDVERILAGLHAGDAVTMQLQQGPVAITAQVQLAASGP